VRLEPGISRVEVWSVAAVPSFAVDGSELPLGQFVLCHLVS
jgi:hypothetical protein